MRKFLAIVCLASLIVSCDRKQAQNSDNSSDSLAASDSLSTDMHNSQNSLNISGNYKGVISCDDCENVELTLNSNNTYSLIIHLSAEERTPNSIINDQGTYTWSADGSTIILDKYNLRFKVGEGKLFYLDHTSEIDEHEVLIKE